jgi:hypothetical protein
MFSRGRAGTYEPEEGNHHPRSQVRERDPRREDRPEQPSIPASSKVAEALYGEHYSPECLEGLFSKVALSS